MRNMLLKGATIALALGAFAGDAQAEEVVSQYTTADVKKCRKFESVKIEGSEHAASWVCKGLGGYVVVITPGLRSRDQPDGVSPICSSAARPSRPCGLASVSMISKWL